MRQDRRYQPLLFALVGVAILAAVIASVGAGRTLRALVQASPDRLLLGTGFLLGVCGLRLLRWYILLKALGSQILLGPLLTSYFLGVAAGMVTPARVGELGASRIAGRAAGIGSAEAASAIAVDRALDLAFLAGGAGVGAAYLHTYGLSEVWLRHLAVAVVIILGALSLALMAAVQGWVGLTKVAGAVGRVTAGRKPLGWLSRMSTEASQHWLPRLHASAAHIRASRVAWALSLSLVPMTLVAQATMYSLLATATLRAPWLLVVACALLALGAAQASGIPGGAGVGAATFVGAALSAGCDAGEATAGALLASAFPTAFVWAAAGVALVTRITGAVGPLAQVAEGCRSRQSAK